MCLIALTTNGAWLTPAEERACLQHNADGMGYMYIRGNRVVTCKSVGQVPLDRIRSDTFAVHWRYATHGTVSRAASHPFWLMNKEWSDPYDLAMMHNGVLRGWGDARRSDTQEYVGEFLRPLLLENPDAIYCEAFWNMVEEDTIGSRLLFAGNTIGWRATPDLRKWPLSSRGCRVSNEYSLVPLAFYDDEPTTPTHSYYTFGNNYSSHDAWLYAEAYTPEEVL